MVRDRIFSALYSTFSFNTFADEVLGADVASERSGSTARLVVRPLVEHQVAFQRERLAAVLAAEGPLAATVRSAG